MLLQLDNIAHFYGSRLLFKEVSFTIHSGSITLLAGQNGAGKTTLMHIIAGLTDPSAGRVTYAKENTTIAMLGHQTFLYNELTARENLTFWSAMQGVSLSNNDIDSVLRTVELTHFSEEKCGTFSRGMAQRLSLARVLLIKPDLMLLDEPSTGLDTKSSAMLYREIQGAKDQGSTILWISHNIDADIHYADYVMLLEKQKAFFSDASEFIAKKGNFSENEYSPQ